MYGGRTAVNHLLKTAVAGGYHVTTGIFGYFKIASRYAALSGQAIQQHPRLNSPSEWICPGGTSVGQAFLGAFIFSNPNGEAPSPG
jgi:hypothetical protein